MLTRKKWLTLVSIGIYILVITGLTLYQIKKNMGAGVDGTTPLTNFWYFQFGGVGDSLISATLTLILFTTIASMESIYLKNNNTFYNVQTRIGFGEFLRRSVGKVLALTFSLTVIIKLYQLGLISLIFGQLPSNIILPEPIRYGLGPFDDNLLTSWLIFTLLSALGWGIYAIFVFAVGLFVPKNSVYLVLGVVLGIIALTIPGILSRINSILTYLMYFIFIPTLIAPGQATFGVWGGKFPPVYLTFSSAALIYLGSAFLLMRVWVSRQRRGG
ncbi:hypothetical protein HU830_05365 [Lactobacillus sp. DCY120]|uniref:Uncharacterized protein n=1 Tax=Bombilactobacillus apium TaxID=2675299 RepID=A0A850R0J9_9LACO|nr:hypothetical protein [Bombilactobacillus apium]NVY96589.1 hypothetical protein [Bombilactobacillus apium]